MSKNQLLNLILVLTFFCSQSLAQKTENFSEQNLPSESIKKEDLTNLSTEDAPIKKLEVNKSTLIKKDDSSNNSIGSLLLNKKVISLMYDDDQNANIDRAVDAFKNNKKFLPEETDEQKEIANEEKDGARNRKSFIYLASILYLTKNDWVVWVNEQKITPSSNRPEKEIYLSSVKNDLIAITWKLSLSKWKILSQQGPEAETPELNESNQVVVKFELKPNQTFSLAENRIFEGRVTDLFLSKKETKAAPTNSDPQQKQGDVNN
ncbi:MAG: hypothetical protein KGP29_00640 [Proteobacteria bacterium]|nr:hypothetical protein [Pseudomonadota bacterium]